MKHIKTFESFKINEASVVDPKKLKQEIEAKINSFSPEEKAELVQQLRDFQGKHHLSDAQMKDPKAVEAALTKYGIDDKVAVVSDTQATSGPIEKPIEEGFSLDGIRNWWERTKKKVFSILSKFGLVGVVASIIDIAIGAEMQSHTIDTAGAEQIVDPNTAVVIGGIAAAVSIASIIIGQIGLNRK